MEDDDSEEEEEEEEQSCIYLYAYLYVTLCSFDGQDEIEDNKVEEKDKVYQPRVACNCILIFGWVCSSLFDSCSASHDN